MLSLSCRVGEGIQIGNAAFLTLIAKERDLLTLQISTRIPTFQFDLGGGNIVKIAPRDGQRVKASFDGHINPITLTPPGIVPQAFCCGIDGRPRYVPKTPQRVAAE